MCMISKHVSIQPLLILRISRYIHCALEENFSVTLKGYTCFTDLSKTTRALSRNYKRKVRDSATERFTRRTESMHDWSKKWLQQKSRYAVKGNCQRRIYFMLCSKELNLQLQLQINFNLSMRQTILWITRYWLPQSSRKFPGQNTDLLFWINKVCDIFFSISEQACL